MHFCVDTVGFVGILTIQGKKGKGKKMNQPAAVKKKTTVTEFSKTLSLPENSLNLARKSLSLVKKSLSLTEKILSLAKNDRF